jgi:hypothetical protein
VFLSGLLERRGGGVAGELFNLSWLHADVVAESEPGEGAVQA